MNLGWRSIVVWLRGIIVWLRSIIVWLRSVLNALGRELCGSLGGKIGWWLRNSLRLGEVLLGSFLGHVCDCVCGVGGLVFVGVVDNEGWVLDALVYILIR